jgi:catalase
MKRIHFLKTACYAIAAIFLLVTNLHAQNNGQTSTPGQLVDALHAAFGDHHSRAVHAKGIILEGTFTPDKQAASLTKAFHLQKKSSKVTIRFSDFTGIPNIPDNSGSANPRGMAIKFQMKDGTSTDIISHSFNGFPTTNSDQFRELLLAISTSGADAPKPTDLDKFLDTHPVAKTFLTTQKNPSSYATISYFGVNSFKFTNNKGQSYIIRYQFIPEEGEQLLTQEEMAKAGSEYLQTEIKTRISKKAFRFKMYAQIAEASDKTDDPSIAWPDSRKKIFLGTVEIKKLADNTTDGDKALSFSPNNIPDGIETADPMLNFRSKAYPISVKGRQ